jgi:hypothetical protein
VVASSAMNLTKSLIDFVPASGSLIDISRETYNWLIRERIDESSFQACQKLALGLAFPNDAGIDIQRQIREADARLIDKIAHLPVRMVVTGSLGRLLAKEPDTCYMVSTVAALTRFHDLEFATETLCSMMLDNGGHEEGVSLKYNVQRSPIKAVMSKIVESIYLNVVNVGHDLNGLPEELTHLHQHLVDDRTFAGVVMGIQRTEKDVVIRSDRFLADLALWLLLHFHGRIEVSVGNRVLFEKELGSEKRVVRIMIKEECPMDSTSCNTIDGPVNAMVSVGDELLTFLKGTDDSDFNPCSFSRQPFYELDALTSGPRSSRSKILNRAECNSVLHVAKVMMSWLLNLDIISSPELHGLTFKLTLENDATSKMKVRDLLKNHPRLLSLNSGFLTTEYPTLKRPDESTPDDESEEWNFEGKHSTPASILEWFPAAKDLLVEIQPRCSCSACESNIGLDQCKRGCLREAATTRLFVLLAHGISDAFDAQDVSGCSNSEDQVTGVTALLSEILDSELIRWDTWFQVVASTTAGIPWNSFDFGGGDGSSSWAAIQYGSFVGVAPWLDLLKEPRVNGCFSILTVEGNIQGVPDDADQPGLVRCEMDQFSKTSQLPPENLGADISEDDPSQMQIDHQASSADFGLAIQPDTLKAEVYTAIFRPDRNLYRLMTTVRAGRNLRIVDPSQAVKGLFYSVIVQCEHDPNLQVPDNPALKIDDFDYVLGEWTSPDSPQHIISMTKVLEEHIKLNTVLSIARRGAVIRVADKCCIPCAITGLLRLERVINPPLQGLMSCIINISASASQQTRMSRK